ncbi:MAG: glycosyltransferase [Bacteroidales bacterium]
MSDKPNTICFFNSHVHWGGGEKWHAEAAEYLYAEDYPVLMCASRNSELHKRIIQSVPVYSVSLSNVSFFNLYKYIKLVRFFKKENVHTIILCLPIDVKVAGVAAKIAGVKNIVYRRGSAIPIQNSWYNRFLFSHIITRIIANSQATVNTILHNNAHLFPRENISVIYNGITIPPVYKKIQNAVPVIVSAGRLEHQKNFSCLISVATMLKRRNYTFRILIAGEGSLYAKLQDEIHQNDVADCVELVGFTTDIYTFLSQGDIFVLPSFWEGFGYVLAEAMTQELPLVAFDISSNKELITNGKNGILVEEKNTLAYADAIAKLLDSEQLRTEMGQEGRKIVCKVFSAEHAHTRIKNFIQELE